MHHAISDYFQSKAGNWVAKLDCEHEQELKHDPPAANNAWVLTQAGRGDKMGVLLVCKMSIAGVTPDRANS
jgi:hypothetical protein